MAARPAGRASAMAMHFLQAAWRRIPQDGSTRSSAARGAAQMAHGVCGPVLRSKPPSVAASRTWAAMLPFCRVLGCDIVELS